MALAQLFETKRDQYNKDFGSNRFNFVRETVERVVEQDNQYVTIKKVHPSEKGWTCKIQQSQ
jgi:hypothetical protein